MEKEMIEFLQNEKKLNEKMIYKLKKEKNLNYSEWSKGYNEGWIAALSMINKEIKQAMKDIEK